MSNLIKEKIDNFAWKEYEDVIETVHHETTYNISNLKGKLAELQTEYDGIDQRKIDLLNQINDLTAKINDGVALGVTDTPATPPII